MDALVTIPDRLITEYKSIVDLNNDDATITCIEKVEALERFGIVLIYKGYYKKAIDVFISSLEASKSKNVDGTLALPNFNTTRSMIRISVYLAAAYYRLANLSSAEKYLKPLMKIKTDQDLIAIALSNLALVLIQLDKSKEAIDRAKEGLAIVEKLYKLDSEQYLYHVRILIMLYMKSEDFNRVNALIDDTLFSPKEKKVLLAGCRFAAGKMEDAYNIIKEAVVNIKEEKEAAIALALAAEKPLLDDAKNSDDKNEKKSNDDTKTDYNSDSKNDDNRVDTNNKEVDNDAQDKDEKEVNIDDKDDQSHSQANPYAHNIRKWTDDVLNTIIKYNYAALQGRRFEYGNERLEQLNDAATIIDSYKTDRQEIEKLVMENDPFIMGHPDDKPHSLSLDYIVAPSVMLSQVLISKAENFIMSSQYLDGLKIQSGLIIDNNNVDNWKSNEISKFIKEAVESMKHIRNNFNTEAKSENDVAIKIKSLFDVEASIQAIENYRVLCDLAVGIPNGNDLDPELQRVAVTLTEKINKVLKLNINATTAMKEKAEEEKDSKEKDFKKSSRGASRGGEKKKLDYDSSMHDKAMVRSELLPFINNFGGTDVALWVQWALSESGGVGYGLFGQISPATSVEGILVSKLSMKDPDVKTYDSFLKEVRARLLEVENDIDKRIISDRDYRQGEKEERILLNAALAKIAAQIGIKEQVAKHVEMMENLVMSLKLINTRNLQNGDVHYIALAKRFRLDYEEWDTPTFLLPDKLLQRLMDLLQIAKDYLNAAEICCDWNLKKDAYKRIINIFCDISNIPQPQSETPIVFETTEKLKYFSEEDINDRETSSPSWTRSFSRARASYYMTKLKELSSMVREEAKIIRTIDNVPADINTHNNNHIEHFTDTITDTITDII